MVRETFNIRLDCMCRGSQGRFNLDLYRFPMDLDGFLAHEVSSIVPEAISGEKDEVDKLKKYYYQYFITRIGSAPYRGSGSSVKKGANNTGNDGMAYRVYGCGIKHGSDPTVVALESVVVLPK